jgi:hypothetical protein
MPFCRQDSLFAHIEKHSLRSTTDGKPNKLKILKLYTMAQPTIVIERNIWRGRLIILIQIMDLSGVKKRLIFAYFRI